jgi:hypothetical protein
VDNNEVAKLIVDFAKENGYITGSLNVVEELLEAEQVLVTMVLEEIRKHIETKSAPELEQEELASLFLLVYSRAIETAYNWKQGKRYSPNLYGLFEGHCTFNVPERLQEHFQQLPFPLQVHEIFAYWQEQNPDFALLHNIHPIIPLAEALKWCFRLSVSLAIDFMESNS